MVLRYFKFFKISYCSVYRNQLQSQIREFQVSVKHRTASKKTSKTATAAVKSVASATLTKPSWLNTSARTKKHQDNLVANVVKVTCYFYL